jgi:DNA polymerase
MKVNGLTNKWEESHAYGGLWAENITQAVARDILAEAITRVSRLGYDVCLSVHDEVVAEMPEGAEWLENLLTQMKALPSWAADLPVAAEGWQGRRYRK